MLKWVKRLILSSIVLCLIPPLAAMAENTPTKAVFKASLEVSENGGPNLTDGEYTFVLEAAENAPLPETTTLTLKRTGEIYFGEATYTSPGNYKYKIYQKQGPSIPGLTYDESVYDVLVQIFTDDKGVLRSEMTVGKQGTSQKYAEVKFVNNLLTEDQYGDKMTESQSGNKKEDKKDSSKKNDNDSGSPGGGPGSSSSSGSPGSSMKGTPSTGDESMRPFLIIALLAVFLAVSGSITTFAGRKRRR